MILQVFLDLDLVVHFNERVQQPFFRKIFLLIRLFEFAVYCRLKVSSQPFLTDLITFTEETLNRKLHFLCN